MDFAPHPAQVATAVSDDPLYRFRVGHPVGRTHGGNVLPVHRLQRDEPAPDTAVELPVAPAVRPHTLPDALFEVVRRAQHDTGTTLQPVLQADKQAQRALRQLVGLVEHHQRVLLAPERSDDAVRHVGHRADLTFHAHGPQKLPHEAAAAPAFGTQEGVHVAVACGIPCACCTTQSSYQLSQNLCLFP